MPGDVGSLVPVKHLRQALGARWKRAGLLRPIPDQPICHLVREADPDELTKQLGEHLDGAVPHVRLAADDPEPATEQEKSVALRTVLDKVALGLGRHDSRRWQGRIRVPRYALASFLLHHNEEPPEPDELPNRQARDLLSRYVRNRLFGRKQRTDETEGQPAGPGARIDHTVARLEPLGLPWYLLLPAMVFAALVPRAARPGILLGRTARWFMRQRYLSPRESADFASFAQRLISTPSVRENALQVRKLLTHALLEDLAHAYRRRGWRWVRREHYPVLLLQGVAPGTTGEMLIRLVNDVRNETGARDPLLIVASGPEALPTGHAPSEPMTPQDWQDRLVEARRKRSPTAWYLPIAAGPAVPAAGGDHNISPWRGTAPVRTRRARFLRAIPALVVLVLVAGFGGWYLHEWREHCRHWDPWAHGDLTLVRGECVGFALSGDHRFSAGGDTAPERELVGLQQWIDDLNDKAARKHRTLPGAPYPTFFYLGSLTSGNEDSTTLAATVEELRGIAAAQDLARRSGIPTRVVVANGGDKMASGAEVARRIRAVMQRADEANRAAVERRADTHSDDDSTAGRNRPEPAPQDGESPVVGVIGLGGSRDGTRKAVDVLGDAGIPAIGAATSADAMPAESRLYYQIAPNNSTEAAVVRKYVEHHSRPAEVFVYTDPGDSYSVDLTARVLEQLRSAAIPAHEVMRIDESLCGSTKMIFFAGRADSLSGFKQNLTCGPTGMPALLAGDDVTKFMLDNDARLTSGQPLHVVSFTGMLHQPSPAGDDGRSALTYDAMRLLDRAVRRVTGVSQESRRDDTPLTSRAVADELRRIGRIEDSSTGVLDYTGGGQVPRDKAITIQRFESGQPPVNELICGQHVANSNPGPDGCTAFPGPPR